MTSRRALAALSAALLVLAGAAHAQDAGTQDTKAMVPAANPSASDPDPSSPSLPAATNALPGSAPTVPATRSSPAPAEAADAPPPPDASNPPPKISTPPVIAAPGTVPPTGAPPTPPAATPASPAAANPPPGAVAADVNKPNGVDEAFELKVKSLEENVNELKEKIFRTKARLLLLQETVLGGDITAGAKAVLVHRNEMGSQFVLESVSYALDGAPIFTRVDNEGDLDKKQEIEIFNGRIVPGNHAVSVKMTYRGHGYGVFSYLEGYKFRVQSSYTFDAEGGKVTQIKIVGYERGNITTDLKDRPAVKYETDVIRDNVKRASADAQAPAEAAPSEARPQ